MQENGAQQHKIYRCTRTFLKIRSTPTDGEQKVQIKEWMPEKENAEFQAPAVPYGSRNLTAENSQYGSSSCGMQPPLPTLDLPNSQFFKEMRQEDGQFPEPLHTSGTTLENGPSAPNDAPVLKKSTSKNFGQEPHIFRDQLYV